VRTGVLQEIKTLLIELIIQAAVPIRTFGGFAESKPVPVIKMSSPAKEPEEGDKLLMESTLEALKDPASPILSTLTEKTYDPATNVLGIVKLKAVSELAVAVAIS
jgi:hypothetical protein